MAGVGKVIRFLGLFLGSIILGFIVTFAISMPFEGRLDELPLGSSTPYFIWGTTALVSMVLMRRLLTTGDKSEILDEIKVKNVESKQFLGSFDKKAGVLETTARLVNQSEVNKPHWASQGGRDFNVIRFRGEILDEHGVPIEYVSVEISALKSDWVGDIVDGDKVMVEGKLESDGILHSTWAYNLSTNSMVGSKK